MAIKTFRQRSILPLSSTPNSSNSSSSSRKSLNLHSKQPILLVTVKVFHSDPSPLIRRRLWPVQWWQMISPQLRVHWKSLVPSLQRIQQQQQQSPIPFKQISIIKILRLASLQRTFNNKKKRGKTSSTSKQSPLSIAYQAKWWIDEWRSSSSGNSKASSSSPFSIQKKNWWVGGGYNYFRDFFFRHPRAPSFNIDYPIFS